MAESQTPGPPGSVETWSIGGSPDRQEDLLTPVTEAQGSGGKLDGPQRGFCMCSWRVLWKESGSGKQKWYLDCSAGGPPHLRLLFLGNTLININRLGAAW